MMRNRSVGADDHAASVQRDHASESKCVGRLASDECVEIVGRLAAALLEHRTILAAEIDQLIKGA
jgi:hypothetical protein